MKILYMEDDRANLRLLQKVFQTRNEIELISAVTALAGIELAIAEQPELILLDIQLPDMDGFTVFSRLKSHPVTQAIPVIAISANAMRHDIKHAERMGFAAYITKPVDFQVLFDTIERVAGGAGGD